MILLVDNYDSFTYNLRRYLVRLGQTVVVLRNDAPDLDAALGACSAIVMSPGPRAPSHAGRCLEIVRAYSGQRPILGICLGHQVICQAFGGLIIRAKRPIHGRDLPILFSPSPLFEGIRSESRFARYHSLVADVSSLPACLSGIAHSCEGEIMAVAHTSHKTYGVQFHPESVLSADGYRLLANFLVLAGLPFPEGLPSPDLQDLANTSQELTIEEVFEHPVVLPASYASASSGEQRSQASEDLLG